jgi:transcriptional regulator with XRE-family HTH domain
VRQADPRLRPFGEALAEALVARGRTQRELADALGITQSAISAWKYGNAEPAPPTVFRIERALGVDPGSLSVHLGFVPAGADVSALGGGAYSFEAAIAGDGRLDERGRRVLRAAYRELVRAERPSQ